MNHDDVANITICKRQSINFRSKTNKVLRKLENFVENCDFPNKNAFV